MKIFLGLVFLCGIFVLGGTQIFAVSFVPNLKNLRVFTMHKVLRMGKNVTLVPVDWAVEAVNASHVICNPTHVAIEKNSKEYIELYPNIILPEDAPYVVVVSRGFAKSNKPGTNDNFLRIGGGIMAAYLPIRDHIINAPCITFDYPEEWRYLNLGQKLDVDCLAFVYNQVRKVCPNAQIIIYGDCRGGKAALSFVSQRPKNLCALVLLSPFASIKELCQHTAKNYVKWIPKGESLIYAFLKWKRIFPSYDANKENIYDDIRIIDPNVPIFIGHRLNDTLISNQHMGNILSALKETGNDKVHFVAVNDSSAPHSKLTPNTTIQAEVNMFFKQYRLPYYE